MSQGLVDGVPRALAKDLKKIKFFCKVCAEVNMPRVSFRGIAGTRDGSRFGTLHSDSKGPMKVLGILGTARRNSYVLSVMDDHTSWGWNFVMKSKDESCNIIVNLLKMLKNLNLGCKNLRTDGGTKFVNSVLSDYTTKEGIIFQQSNRYTKEENGGPERDHRTLFTKVRAALKAAKGYIRNRTPRARLNWETPYHRVMGKTPNISELKVWGCICYAHLPEDIRTDKDLQSRGIKCKFLGISETKKAYRLYDIYNNKFLEAADVVFDSNSADEIISTSFNDDESPLTAEEVNEIDTLGTTAVVGDTTAEDGSSDMFRSNGNLQRNPGIVGDPEESPQINP